MLFPQTYLCFIIFLKSLFRRTNLCYSCTIILTSYFINTNLCYCFIIFLNSPHFDEPSLLFFVICFIVFTNIIIKRTNELSDVFIFIINFLSKSKNKSDPKAYNNLFSITVKIPESGYIFRGGICCNCKKNNRSVHITIGL